MMETPWIDTRLSQEEMDFLWQIISEENKEDLRHDLAGNISKSELIVDKDNWFYETALKKLTERMFYRDYSKKESQTQDIPKFELTTLWVNYQKQHEFNPIHNHSGLYSFVIFIKIPTHWKEQHALPFSAHSNAPHASDFVFVWKVRGTISSSECVVTNFSLSPEDEGRILFFPAYLQHQVYPFYGTEKERVTISGNIVWKNRKDDMEEFFHKLGNEGNNEYEKKENMLKILENSVKITKEELKWMKKAGEKEE